jgi:DNA-binding NarL/FixJ family response regulator
MQLKVGLVISNHGLWEEVQGCLRDLPVRVLMQQAGLGDPAVFLDQLEQLRLDVLIIDLTQLAEPFEQVARRIKSVSVAPMIIALNETADPEVILGAIRAGANEFLYPPLQEGCRASAPRATRPPASEAGRWGFSLPKGAAARPPSPATLPWRSSG